MSANLRSALCRRRPTRGGGMQDYDRLPAPLRGWIARAALPWTPRSVSRRWQEALRTHRGDIGSALAELDRIEARLLARDKVVLDAR